MAKGESSIPIQPTGRSKEHFVQRVSDRSGVESPIPLSDTLFYSESEELGSILIGLQSDNQLEEDLMQIDDDELVLQENERKKIVQESFRDVIKEIGQYVDSVQLEYLFPGMDVLKPELYDFKNSRIRIFILSHKEHKEFRRLLYGENDGSEENSFATGDTIDFNSRFTGKDRMTSISERTLIIVNELQGLNVYMGRQGIKDYETDELSIEEREILKYTLKSIIVHEILHKLGVGSESSREFMEGFVEFRTQMIMRRKSRSNPNVLDKVQFTSYEYETDAIALLMKMLVREGITMDQWDRAFVSRDEEEKKKIIKPLEDSWGKDAVKKLLDLDFYNRGEMWDFVVNLYEEHTGEKVRRSFLRYRTQRRAADGVQRVTRKLGEKAGSKPEGAMRVDELLKMVDAG